MKKWKGTQNSSGNRGEENRLRREQILLWTNKLSRLHHRSDLWLKMI